jgi:hypothetical protein
LDVETSHGFDSRTGEAHDFDTVAAVAAKLGERVGRFPIRKTRNGQEVDCFGRHQPLGSLKRCGVA